MAGEPTAPSFETRFPDPDAARQALGEIFTNALKATHKTATQALAGEPLAYDPMDKAKALFDFGMGLVSQPTKLVDAQMSAWNEWSALWTTTLKRLSGEEAAPVIAPARGDRRFNDPAWSQNVMFDHIKQTYLLASKQVTDLVASVEGVDPVTRTKVNFLVKQYLDAVAPSNFPATNPEALRKATETGGMNLLNGLANLLADAASGEGLVQRRAADPFELGVNIAATPGSVVFQTPLFQLIQYDPTTENVGRRPILYVPPLVNKYYLVDLQPKQSLLKWLVDEGNTVFVISWVNPGPELRDADFSHYVTEGVIAAMDAVKTVTGEPDVDLTAFCMGGILSTAAAAYLAAKGQGSRVGSITMIGTLLDFSDMGEWSVVLGEGDRKAFARAISGKGYVESHDLQKLFSIMRANDLIWSSAVNHYLLDKEAPPSDILWWFADGARIPAAFLKSYGDSLISGNGFSGGAAGGVVVDGIRLDLKAVEAPVMMVSLKDDHVSAWEATYAGTKLFGGPVRFLLGGSGHNAGLINPPSANKHGHWTNDSLPDTALAWLEGATKNEGSWWPAWSGWLKANDGAEVPARKVGKGKLKAIEPAPGSYVRVR